MLSASSGLMLSASSGLVMLTASSGLVMLSTAPGSFLLGVTSFLNVVVLLLLFSSALLLEFFPGVRIFLCGPLLRLVVGLFLRLRALRSVFFNWVISLLLMTFLIVVPLVSVLLGRRLLSVLLRCRLLVAGNFDFGRLLFGKHAPKCCYAACLLDGFESGNLGSVLVDDGHGVDLVDLVQVTDAALNQLDQDKRLHDGVARGANNQGRVL